MLFAALGCSDDAGEQAAEPRASEGAQWIRATWSPTAERSAPTERAVAHLDASNFTSAWRVEEEVGRVELALDMTPSEPTALRLTGTGARLASMPVALQASDLHRAVVLLDVPDGEKEYFRMSFHTGERTRAYTEPTLVAGGPGTERLELDLAQVRPLEGELDRIDCGTLGTSTGCEILSLAFSKLPQLHYLPTPHDGAKLVSVGDDSRLGVALDGSHPVSMELTAPAGAAFQLSYRVGPREVLGDAFLVLDGLGTEAQRLPLAADGYGWRVFRQTLNEPLAAPVRVSLECGAGANPEEALTLVADAGARVGTPAPSPSTVLLITSDPHRGELLGVTSDGLVRTPALDALAARGVVFEDASSTSNATNPSHVALMTGLHPRDTHVVTNRDPVSRSAHTLAEHFAAAGWRTAAAFSAFHLGDDTSGLGQGFDRYDGPGAPTGMQFNAFAGAASAVRGGEATVARALEQAESSNGVPLFLWVHVFDAHAPYLPQGAFNGRYRPADSNPRAEGPGLAVPARRVPMFLRGVREPLEPWRQYRALVDYVDDLLTPLLTLPRVAGGITAFTSDHGESFGEHGIWWNHAGVYPATTHVPLVLAWPGAEPRHVETPVNQSDLGRTLLNLAGINTPDFAGRDLSWAMEEAPLEEPRFTLGYFARSASVDDGRWFLVLHLLSEENDEGTHTWQPGEVELFDRRADPQCLNNVVDADLDRARRMRARLIQWLGSGDPEGLKGEYHVKAAIDKALSELGYAGGSAEGGAWYDPERGDLFIERYGEQ